MVKETIVDSIEKAIRMSKKQHELTQAQHTVINLLVNHPKEWCVTEDSSSVKITVPNNEDKVEYTQNQLKNKKSSNADFVLYFLCLIFVLLSGILTTIVLFDKYFYQPKTLELEGIIDEKERRFTRVLTREYIYRLTTKISNLPDIKNIDTYAISYKGLSGNSMIVSVYVTAPQIYNLHNLNEAVAAIPFVYSTTPSEYMKKLEGGLVEYTIEVGIDMTHYSDYD